MATSLELTNSVLKRLRESEVATYNESTISTLISDLVNEAKRKVEDAWDWNALRTTVTVTTAAGTSQYALTGAGKRWRLYDDYSGWQGVWNDTNDCLCVLYSFSVLARSTKDCGCSPWPLGAIRLDVYCGFTLCVSVVESRFIHYYCGGLRGR